MENEKSRITKLEEWANEIIDYCSPIAEKLNLEYYPFQSPLNINNTKVLLVGINPRNNGNYLSQNSNSNWEYLNGRMISERLLKGNPYFELNSTKWRFFTNLKQINFLKNIIESREYTYMNYFYFSTPDAMQMRKIEGFEHIITFSQNKLVNLVKIIKPRLIVILGVQDSLDIISDIPVKTIFSKENKRILTSGAIDNVKVYGIPHPSRNYAYNVRGALSECLEYLFENEHEREISKEEIISKLAEDISKMNEKRNNPAKAKAQDILSISSENLKKKWNLYDIQHNRFEIANKRLSLTITTSEGGYIGIRYMDKNKIEDNTIQSKIIEILGKFGFKPLFNKNAVVIWLGMKKFKDFQGNSNNSREISENIILELTELGSELENIYS